MRISDKNPAFYDAFLAPMELVWFSRWRRSILSSLSGHVLDIGSGTGVNLRHYPEKVDCVTVLDPNHANISYLRRKAAGSSKRCLRTRIGRGEQLPFGSGTFDGVVSTLILCTVEDPRKVVSEAVRVLKTGGKLIFMEHQLPRLAPQAFLFDKVTPLWKAPSRCHLNRETESLIDSVDGLKSIYVRRKGPLLGYPFLLKICEKS
ncbi:MAG: class I SAM-dependent methyltransferase [Thermoplasmatota archaeon]